MITKTIQLEFANPNIRAIDHIQDIRRAAEYAGLNLFGRYDVQLQYPMPTDDNNVVVEIKIPDTMAESFSVGNRLRGISTYLLKHYRERYEPYLVGNRLLNYIDLQETVNKQAGLSNIARLEAIVSFTKLLERSDEKAMAQIERIIEILEEE